MNLTKDELYWIERTADLESARAMQEFCKAVQVPLNNLEEKEKIVIKKYVTELTELFTFLKTLRVKMEIERKNEMVAR